MGYLPPWLQKFEQTMWLSDLQISFSKMIIKFSKHM